MKNASSGASVRAALLTCASMCAVSSVHAQNGTWIGTTSGTNWSDTANWADNNADTIGDPPAAGGMANLSTADIPAVAFTVNLSAPVDVSQIAFGDLDAEGTPGTWVVGGASNLTLSGSAILDTSVTTTINSVITGSAGLTKAGAANLILTAANTFTGNVAVNAGQLTTKNGAALATSTITLANGTHYRYERAGNNSTFQGNAINVAPASTVTITSDNAGNGYSGVITADANSVINIGSSGNLAQCSFSLGSNTQQFGSVSGLVKIFDGASLRFSSTSGVNNGGSNATFDVGAGADLTTRNSATINLGALTGTGFVTGSGGATGTATFSVGAKGIDSTFGGVIRDGNTSTSRFAILTKVGAGKLTLTGANTHTGATNVNAGSLEIGDGGTTGSLGSTTANVAAGANLVFNTGGTQSNTGVISGAGNVIKRGSGRTLFSGNNTYTSNTRIEGGELAINADTALGNAASGVEFSAGSGKLASDGPGVVTPRAITVAAGATGGFSAVDVADSLQVDGVVSGNGAIEIGGNGVVILTNANTYLGNTTIISGALSANNATGSATSAGTITVNGGSLGGTGTIAGAVTIASGGHLKPGAIASSSTGVESLSVGALNLSGGSTLHVEFANASNYDTVAVTNAGGLTTTGASVSNPVLVDLRQENSVANFTTLGTYNLIQYSGSFSGNVNDLFEVTAESKQAGVTYTFGASGGFITLTLGGTAPPAWNVDASGTWATASNWINGVPNASGANAILGSVITAPRTLTLAAPATVGLLTFNNANSYHIAGTSTLTLNTPSGNATATVLLGDHTISAPVNLSKALDVILSHDTDSLSITGVISGSTGINKSSAGDLLLGGNSTLFSGPVNFSNGTLAFANGGLGTGALTINNASLLWAEGNSQDISGRAINFGDGSVTFNTGFNNVTLANDIGNFGSATFNKSGDGRLTFAADTTFTGAITISEGSLQIGNGGVTGSLEGEILNNAELRIAKIGDIPFVNAISGTGSLVHVGPGNLQLAGLNTFTGTTSITSGSIALFSAQALQNSTLNYVNGGGTLDFDLNPAVTFGGLEGDKNLALTNLDALPVVLTIGNNGIATTYSGNLSGDGSLVKTGTGVTLLSGDHTYTGGTTVNGGAGTGALELDQGGSITGGALTVTGNARFSIFDGSYVTSAASSISNGGTTTATFEVMGGSATFSGGLSATGNMNIPYLISVPGGTLTASTLTLGRTSQSVTAEPLGGINTAGLFVNGGTVNVEGAFLMGNGGNTNSSVNVKIDSGALNIGGAFTVGLNNGGRWSVVDLNGGVLTSTDAATGIQLGGAMVGNAALIINAGTATAERIQFGQGTNSGTHVLRLAGNGELYVGSGGLVDGTTSDASFIRLTGGTLGAKAAWSTTLPVELTNTATIRAADAANVSHDISITGAVTGAGNLVKTGGGSLTLGGTYAYAGGTTVEQGTLTLPTASLSDTAPVEIKGNATLNLTHSATDSIKGFLIDGISQTAGTWGRIGSPTATYKTARITGDGILNVLPDDPFAAWIAGYPSLSGPNAEKGADPDGDGMTNLEEFAFNSAPDSAIPSGKIRARIETVGTEQALVITIPVRNGAAFDNVPGPGQDATIDKIAYVVRGTNDLANFDQGVTEIPASTANLPNLDAGWTYHSFRLNGAIGGTTPRGPKGFISATATASETP